MTPSSFSMNFLAAGSSRCADIPRARRCASKAFPGLPHDPQIDGTRSPRIRAVIVRPAPPDATHPQPGRSGPRPDAFASDGMSGRGPDLRNCTPARSAPKFGSTARYWATSCMNQGPSYIDGCLACGWSARRRMRQGGGNSAAGPARRLAESRATVQSIEADRHRAL